MVTYRWCATTFLSLIGAVTGLSNFSFSGPTFSDFAVFSEYDELRTGVGTDARGGATEFDEVSCFAGEEAPDVAELEFILRSDRIASFVENIRVSRFVIDGFSAVAASSFCCGSEGGAAPTELLPFKLRASTAGIGVPFCDVTGRDTGELTAEEV